MRNRLDFEKVLREAGVRGRSHNTLDTPVYLGEHGGALMRLY